MATVLRGLLNSELADRYDFEMIVTWRSAEPIPRLTAFLRAIVQLIRWSIRPGPRLVHVHAAVRGSFYRKAVCVFVVRLLRRPVVLHVHAGVGDIEAFDARLDPLRRWLFHIALGGATRVLAVSAESARAIESCFAVEGILVIPNAAPPLPASEPTDRSGESDATVLYIGGFANPVKGGLTLLEAIGSVAEQMPEARFILGGPGDPPPALVSLEEKRSNVRWVGWLDEAAKNDAFRNCSIFVLPSTSEGLPMALLEAMTWGRAIVATAAGGVPEVVTDGVDALLVTPGDAGELAEAIEVLMNDRGKRRRLGLAARDRAAAFNHEDVDTRLDSLYRDLAR